VDEDPCSSGFSAPQALGAPGAYRERSTNYKSRLDHLTHTMIKKSAYRERLPAGVQQDIAPPALGARKLIGTPGYPGMSLEASPFRLFNDAVCKEVHRETQGGSLRN